MSAEIAVASVIAAEPHEGGSSWGPKKPRISIGPTSLDIQLSSGNRISFWRAGQGLEIQTYDDHADDYCGRETSFYMPLWVGDLIARFFSSGAP